MDLSEDGLTLSYTFSENGELPIDFEDTVGNKGNVILKVDNIDKTPPTGEVAYSKVTPTNSDVTATITPSEDVIYTSDGGSSHTFTENGSFTFEFVDKAGNKGSAVAMVSNIDKIKPTAEVMYPSNMGPTNQDVVVTINPSETVKVTNNNGALSYTFKDNGSFTFEFEDEAGNTGTATAIVSNIDKIIPTAKVIYPAETEPTNQDVVVTIEPSEEVKITSQGGASHTFTDNGSFTFEFEDLAGNKGSAVAVVSNIDKVPPTASIGYSTTSLVNTDVIATIVNPSEPIKVTNTVDGSLNYRFTQNGLFTFEFVDAAGNKGTAVATVNNIDKTSPIGSIEYSETKPTNGIVTATLNPSKPVTVTNTVYGTLSYTFNDNGSFTFEFTDAAGNTGTAVATVNNIDRTAPTATVTYSTTALTSGNVIATITPSEDVTVTNNNGSKSYTFYTNGSFTFEFVDAAGNKGTTVATVNNVDKTAPTATVSYSTTSPTNKDVVATITPSEDVTVTNNNGSKSYTFTDNGLFTFTFTDAAGNVGSVTAVVNNIDKTAPVISGVVNGQTYTAAVAPTFNEGTATLNGQPFVSGTTISTNGSYTLSVIDEAGNATSVQFTVNLTVVANEIIFSSLTPVAQGLNQFKIVASYTVIYSNGTTKTVNNATLSGGNVSNPGTQNANKSSKDYTIEGLVYTVTVMYDSSSGKFIATADKK
ncbi:autotransporter outer membrane beta-barrel domain-containing protein [Paenibacillus aestuarii]|uniref:Uncharacterized protein n=1 Tax=Paenibacillus aestuarii TaxID=516965 RepID=A0ABW0KFG4_9BACL|nr:hypothetical protein [Paenibacillus aestuarii]